MNDENDNNENVESEEEDYEIYFLQPASSPYNIKEKIEIANKALFAEDVLVFENRELKIKFKEELVDYEPDLTDDDVQSIESYNEVDYLLEQELLEEATHSQSINKIELNIFTPVLNVTEEEEEEDEEEESEDVNKEEHKSNGIIRKESKRDLERTISFDVGSNGIEREDDTSTDENTIVEDEFEKIESDVDSYSNNCSDEIADVSNITTSSNSISDGEIEEIEDIEEIEEINNILRSDDTETKETTSFSSTRTLSSTSSKRTRYMQGGKLSQVHCKSHCIDRLESELDLTISKLHINEKPLCPALKLIKRKCCERNHAKNDQKLPCYSGLRSEYGLSLQQLEKRQKRRELTRIREEKRKRLIEEYKQRKMQQNEEIFCQWLKNVQRRKHEQIKKQEKKSISPKILNIPNKYCERSERPKTSYPLIPSHSVKKMRRPNTSTACVFIQVPRNVLKKGLRVGEIIVSSSKKVPCASGLHVLSVS